MTPVAVGDMDAEVTGICAMLAQTSGQIFGTKRMPRALQRQPELSHTSTFWTLPRQEQRHMVLLATAASGSALRHTASWFTAPVH